MRKRLSNQSLHKKLLELKGHLNIQRNRVMIG